MNLWEVYFKRNAKVTWRALGNDCILLHLKSGIYYTLNEGGRLLWESLDGKKKFAEIQEEMIDQYEVDPDTLKQDMIEILQDMIKEDLVEYEEGPQSHTPIS